MLLLALSAAGLLVGPVPDIRRVRGPSDYPTEMLQADKSVSAEVEAIISPAGEIESCKLVSFVGDERFAQRVCGLLDKRTWNASRDVQGNAVYGRIRTLMRFTLPKTKEGQEAQRAKPSSDLEIPLPTDWQGGDEIDVPVAALVGEDGHIEACSFQPTPMTEKKAAQLADLACQGIALKSYGPLETHNGPVQRYVALQTVRFSRAKP